MGRPLGLDVRTGAVVANISLGYSANSLVADPYTRTVYATGCAGSFVCASKMSIVNGTSKHLYFFILPFSSGLAVKHWATDKKIEGEYIRVNPTSGRFSPTIKPTFDAQSIAFPILEVKLTVLLGVMKL